jgi:hypothetical protein
VDLHHLLLAGLPALSASRPPRSAKAKCALSAPRKSSAPSG